MRDLILIVIVVAGCLAALKRPWIGVMLWTWLSLMNPHRYTYGIALTAPLAAMAAACLLMGFLISKEKTSPFKGRPVTYFVLFIVWITFSWLLGVDVIHDYEQWKKVMKINGMLLIALMILRSKRDIFALIWVSAMSLAVLGAKGGLFTLLTGGSERVWGPPGTFIGDNNEFALALVMVIPFLRFLQLQVLNVWGKRALMGLMLLCAVAALGSQSRGALLAISAMSATLWWRGTHKIQTAIFLLVMAVPIVVFMPDSWSSRMSTIQTYNTDESAMGRINAWWQAWNIAQSYLTGVGFNPATAELYARFAPNPDMVLAAHSIYFQVMGNHGFVGLLIFLCIWFSTWFMASSLRNQKKPLPQTQWCADLGSMCQVSLVGYAIGGAFLSLAYFDFPYIVMVVVVLSKHWLEKESWKQEPTPTKKWWELPGLALK